MKNYILTTQKFHENNFKIYGEDFQRKFPDENVIKFTKTFLKKNQNYLMSGQEMEEILYF